MTVRKYAVQLLIVALPFCAGVSATSAISDPFDDQIDGVKANGSVPSARLEAARPTVEITIPPAAPSPPPPAEQRPLSANPLWGMPVKEFNVTRERPIFLPSRRPPAPPPSIATVAKVVAPPKPKEPEQPQLSLVGTISSDEDKFGIFVDQATKNVLRLRVGDDFQGWKLQSVRGREVAFLRNQQSFVLALPPPAMMPTVGVREDTPGVSSDGRLLPVTRQRPGLK